MTNSFIRSRIFIVIMFVAASVISMIPFFVLMPSLMTAENSMTLLLPAPLAAALLGYAYATPLSLASDKGRIIDGANIGIRVAFFAWILYVFVISIPFNHVAGSEFSWQDQFMRSLSIGLMVSAVAMPIVCIVGGITGAAYVAFADRKRKK